MKTGRLIFLTFFMAMLSVAGFLFLAASSGGSGPAGPYTLSENASLFIATEEEPDPELLETVRTMDSLFAAAGVPSAESLPVRWGKRAWADAGDLVVLLDPAYESDLPNGSDQGYTLTPAADGTLEITAATTDGLWYGLTELLQRSLLGRTTIRKALTSAPYSSERTLLLDCGRKYYSPDWIENLIRRMSWQRYTSLHLHFSDAEGFGLESRQYPWLNEGNYLTFDELTEICETARRYHIEIIPELDSPGHLRYIVEHYAAHAAQEPDFTFDYQGRTYSASGEGGSTISNYYVYGGARSGYSNAGIDLSNETATAFLGSLIDEYADFFAEQGSTSFCIGGDELFGWVGASVGGRSFTPYNLWEAMEHWATYAREHLGIEDGSASDTFISYLNDMSVHLGEKGLDCRVWNDQLLRTENQHVALDPAIDIVYWTNDYTPMQRLVEGGNRIFSSNTDWCYYVLRRDKLGGDIMDRTRRYCNSENIYENWNPRNCASPKQEETLIPEDSYAGGYFCIWSDSPDYKDEVAVWDETEDRTWANAAKLWDDDMDERLSYKKFLTRVRKLGTFPGYDGDCEAEVSLPNAPEPQHVQLTKWEEVKRMLHLWM